MRLREKWECGGGLKLLLAFAINGLFLALMLTCFQPVFETNDDMLMTRFVDGQLSHKSAYVPFINICLGWLLKIIYTLGGDGVQWYSVCQYTALLLGFTALTWTLLRRFRLFPALVMTVVVLSAFAADCYLSMNFSKASAVATVGGLSLMLYAMRNETGRVLRLPLGLGVALGVVGYVWRFEEFFVCCLLMSGIGLCAMAEIGAENRAEPRKIRTRLLLRYAGPFMLLLALALGLLGINTLAWNTEEYKDYSSFDWTRSFLIDYGMPEYSDMPEAYEQLGWNETAVKLMRDWNFYDTEVFTEERMQAVIDVRDDYVKPPSLSRCLYIFLTECLLGFCQDRPVAGFVFLLLFFIVCGRRRGRDWLALLWMLGWFLITYLLFIRTYRYLANRVDLGLFLAMAAGLSVLIDPERLKGERIFCALVLLLSLFIGYRSCRSVCIYDSHNTLEDNSADKASIERVLEDKEHLYFYKFLSVGNNLYGPLETPPEGYADTLVLIGGYICRHPETERVFARFDVENPYQDLIGSDRLYLIDNDIKTTLRFIHAYHDPEATAELVEPMSSKTGLKIYRILK